MGVRTKIHIEWLNVAHTLTWIAFIPWIICMSFETKKQYEKYKGVCETIIEHSEGHLQYGPFDASETVLPMMINILLHGCIYLFGLVALTARELEPKAFYGAISGLILICTTVASSLCAFGRYTSFSANNACVWKEAGTIIIMGLFTEIVTAVFLVTLLLIFALRSIFNLIKSGYFGEVRKIPMELTRVDCDKASSFV